MESSDLVKALKEVPECRLRLLELAREAVKKDGTLDDDMLMNRYKEIKEAADEAEDYARETQEAVRCLMDLVKG